MYLQGVSTRKVAKVMNEICGGNGVSATYVNQCTAQLDAQAHVTSVRYRSIAAAHIRNIFNADNRASAELIQNALSIFGKDRQHKLADCLEENIEKCLTIID